MDELDTMVNKIAEYCDENRIEFIFGCVKDDQNILAYHLDKNEVLKKAFTILDKLIRK